MVYIDYNVPYVVYLLDVYTMPLIFGIAANADINLRIYNP